MPNTDDLKILLDSLPQGHHERPGLIRAIEILRVETPMWDIDQDGRVFFEGKFAFTVSRDSESDGRFSTNFRAIRLLVVKDTGDDEVYANTVFEGHVTGSSADVKLTENEWKAINNQRSEVQA